MMPLVTNDYRLEMPDGEDEDPKEVLHAVAVAAIVAILRQIGDLTDFAAEVFHGLQEQVLMTSSRSHILAERVHNFESALPPLENAVLAQRTHLHFAYTPGSHWHTRLRTEQNHFIYSDLPQCIMDSYEECHDPPKLHKLDKFETSGPGSCFKRYSDPTYFQRASTGSYERHLQSVQTDKKARRSKKKRSLSGYKGVKPDAPIFTHGGSLDFVSSNSNGTTSSIHDAPKSGTEPEMEHPLNLFECILRPSHSAQPQENQASESNTEVPDENIENNYVEVHTWDEKLEIMDSSNEPNGTEVISSGMFEFRNRLLVNGFRRQVSLVGDEKLAGSLRSGILKGYQSVTGRPFRDENGSPLTAPTSPSLQHMTISFQPIDGFETCKPKTKLKFPDGDTFQLVPEPDVSLHESHSDSDDDSFCRSSYHSESNSDDDFGRISSAEESVSGSLRFQQDFDSLHAISHQVNRNSDRKYFDYFPESNSPNDPTPPPPPPPPPLPPLEWRGAKSHPDVTIEKEDAVSRRTAPLKEDRQLPKHNELDVQNLNVREESNCTTKKAIENEDFLQQIRTILLNLRPTSTPNGPIIRHAIGGNGDNT